MCGEYCAIKIMGDYLEGNDRTSVVELKTRSKKNSTF